MTDLARLTPRKVLLIWIGRLGDFLTATPFLASMRQRFPGAIFTLMTGVKARAIAELDPNADHCWTLHPFHRPLTNIGLWARLLRCRFDLTVDLNPSPSRDSGVLTLLSQAPIRISFEKRFASLFYTDTVPHDPERDNMVLSYGRLAKRLGAPFDPRLKVHLRPEHERVGRQLLKTHGPDPSKLWLAVHAGNFKKVQNRWPEEKFIELTRRLLSGPNPTPPLEIFYLAGPGEEQPVQGMLRELQGIHYIPPQPAPVSAALLGQMDLLLANSTGTMHLAAASGTPTFTLFSRYTRLVWSIPKGPHWGVTSEAWSDCRDIPVDKAYLELLSALKRVQSIRRPRELSD